MEGILEVEGAGGRGIARDKANKSRVISFSSISFFQEVEGGRDAGVLRMYREVRGLMEWHKVLSL